MSSAMQTRFLPNKFALLLVEMQKQYPEAKHPED